MQSKRCRHNFLPPQGLDGEQAKENGSVLLIDEIDKADISLANGLLEVLGNREFQVPPLGETISSNPYPPPLVVLTSNDTRQMPAPLLRRCVVLTLALPEEPLNFFVERGRTHYPDMDSELLERAARQILEDRERCSESAKTGLAEYLDLLQALSTVAQTPERQKAWLDKLGGYFRKSRAV